jgi:hypothetical protein
MSKPSEGVGEISVTSPSKTTSILNPEKNMRLQEYGVVFSITLLNNTIIYKCGARKMHFNYIIGLILPIWAEKSYYT